MNFQDQLLNILTSEKVKKAFNHHFSGDESNDIKYFWNLWSDPKEWNDVCDDSLDENGNSCLTEFNSDKNIFEFIGDYISDIRDYNDELLQKYLSDTTKVSKCFVRTYEPNDEFVSNFRLKILFSPSEEIIGWSIFED